MGTAPFHNHITGRVKPEFFRHHSVVFLLAAGRAEDVPERSGVAGFEIPAHNQLQVLFGDGNIDVHTAFVIFGVNLRL